MGNCLWKLNMEIPISGTDYSIGTYEPYTESTRNIGWYIGLAKSSRHPFLKYDSIIVYTARSFGFCYTTSCTYYMEYRNGILSMEP